VSAPYLLDGNIKAGDGCEAKTEVGVAGVNSLVMFIQAAAVGPLQPVVMSKCEDHHGPEPALRSTWGMSLFVYVGAEA
jgi:hypothetical protein